MATPEIYNDVFEALNRENVRYIVISGVAVVLHGYVRPIFDLDIVIDRAPEEAHSAMRTLTASGFVPTIPLPLSAVTVLRMFDPVNREIDLFVRYYIPFEEMWSASEMIRLNNSLVRVASLEHLIKVKQINGRPHDLQDIEGLLATAKPGDSDPFGIVKVGEAERDAS
jgi:hypothetical protein